jgi:hypothetical protein
MNDTETSPFDHAVELFESIGIIDEHPPGTPTGEPSQWLFTKKHEKRETPEALGRRKRYATKARFQFYRTDSEGSRYDGYVVVSFMADPRDGYSGSLLFPSIYTRWYDIKPLEQRVRKSDCKIISSEWFLTGRSSISVDEALTTFDHAADALLENAEVCGSPRRQQIAEAASTYWNDPGETEATSLSDF